MTLQASQTARLLLTELAGYHAQIELMCIAVASGGKRIAASDALGPLYRAYVALVPSGAAHFVELVGAQREVLRALCNLRDARRRPPAEATGLARARARHEAALRTLAVELLPLAG